MNLQKSEILFRCSRLGDLITGNLGLTANQTVELARLREKQVSGKITDKQIVTLGELIAKDSNKEEIADGTRTYVRSVWMQNEFGYKEDVMTDEMLKGFICEQDSMGLIQSVLGGEFRAKNTKRFRNEFIEGTPDIVLRKEDCVEDAKSSSSLRTFLEADTNKLYEWQGQGYMWLTGKKNFRLIYCLNPTPQEIIDDQIKRWYYKFNQDDSNDNFIEIAGQIQKNSDLIREIPENQRVKVFESKFDPEKIELLKVKIKSAREYYKTLALPEFQSTVSV